MCSQWPEAELCHTYWLWQDGVLLLPAGDAPHLSGHEPIHIRTVSTVHQSWVLPPVFMVCICSVSHLPAENSCVSSEKPPKIWGTKESTFKVTTGREKKRHLGVMQLCCYLGIHCTDHGLRSEFPFSSQMKREKLFMLHFLAQILWGNMELCSYCLASPNLMLNCYSVLFWYHLIPFQSCSYMTCLVFF